MRRLLLLIALVFINISHGQHSVPNVATDPIIKSAADPRNWHPGGKYFGFGSIRGTLTNPTDSLSITRLSQFQMGSFSMQHAIIRGSVKYKTVFDNHPFYYHAPFDEVSKRSDSAKNDSNDGGQVSYNLEWEGTMVHPADAYTGMQGGGYPSPTGARDEYHFAIDGVAVGTYFVPDFNQLNAYDPSLGNRWDALKNAIPSLQEHGAHKINDALNNGDLSTIHRIIMGTNGILELVSAPIFGGIGGFVQPEFSQAQNVGHWIIDDGSIKSIQALDPKTQFEVIKALDAGAYIASAPGVGDTIELGGWLVAGSKVKPKPGKTPINKTVIDPKKFDYLFGKSNSNTHNAARSNQLALEMKRLGIHEDANGKNILTNHFQKASKTEGNIINKFSNNYGSFEVRESLLIGPSGKAVKLETTFQIMKDGSSRFVTTIPRSGTKQ